MPHQFSCRDREPNFVNLSTIHPRVVIIHCLMIPLYWKWILIWDVGDLRRRDACGGRLGPGTIMLADKANRMAKFMKDGLPMPQLVGAVRHRAQFHCFHAHLRKWCARLAHHGPVAIAFIEADYDVAGRWVLVDERSEVEPGELDVCIFAPLLCVLHDFIHDTSIVTGLKADIQNDVFLGPADFLWEFDDE